MLSRRDFSILQYISLNLHNFSLFLPPLVCANITEKKNGSTRNECRGKLLRQSLFISQFTLT